jgi:type II secretory pathway pseudopilin PulG
MDDRDSQGCGANGPCGPTPLAGRPGEGSPRGVYLIEIVAAVSLIACLALIAIPGFTALMEGRALSAARERVAADLRQAQMLAVRSGGMARLHWGNDPAVNQPQQYRLESCAGSGAACDPPAPATPWTPVPGPWYSLANDVPTARLTSITNAANAPLAEVRFNAQGGLTVPSRIRVTVSVRNSAAILEVTRSGAIRVASP